MRTALIELFLNIHLIDQKKFVRQDIVNLVKIIKDYTALDAEEGEVLPLAEQTYEKIKFDRLLIFNRSKKSIVHLKIDSIKEMADYLEAYLGKQPMPGLFAMRLLKNCLDKVFRQHAFAFNEDVYPNLFSCQRNISLAREKVKNVKRSAHEFYINNQKDLKETDYQELEEKVIIAFIKISLRGSEDESLKLSLIIDQEDKERTLVAELKKFQTLSLSVNRVLLFSLCTSLGHKYQRVLLFELMPLVCLHQDEFRESLFNVILESISLPFYEVGRIFLKDTRLEKYLPKEFKWIPVVEREASYSLYAEELKEGDADGEILPLHRLQFMLDESERINIRFSETGQRFSYSEDEEQPVGKWHFIFKPSQGRVYYFSKPKVQLHLKDLSLERGDRNIISNISASISDGDLVGVVGASGCGKSTLLMLLAGLVETNSNAIFINGRRCINQDNLAGMSTYISQDDILFKELSVEESISYAASLLLKENSNRRNKRVQDVMEYLHLEEVANLKIGDEQKKGISGGQRKRVGIALSIVAGMKPILLFDEPNSGLDSSHSLEMIQLMRIIAKRGHIVMVATHDLKEDVSHYFDKYLVLSSEGEMAYFGDKDSILKYFQISKFEDLHYLNDQDFDKISHEKFQQSSEGQTLAEELKATIREDDLNLEKSNEFNEFKKSKPGMLRSCVPLLQRELLRKKRDPMFLSVCLIQPVVIALILCWDFSGPLPNALFALVVSCLWIGSVSGVREVNTEIPQIRKEFLSGVHTGAYFIAKIMSCFAFAALQVFLLTTIFVWNKGMYFVPYRFDFFPLVGVLFILTLIGLLIGLFLSVSFKSPLSSLAVLPLILIPLMIKGGVLFRYNQTEGLKEEVVKFNPVRMSFEAVLLCGERVLAPPGYLDSIRDEAMAKRRLARWNTYLERLNLFKKNPEEYRKRYGEIEADHLLSNILNDKSDAEVKALSKPMRPPGSADIDLLLHYKDLWLKGYSLYSVDKPEGLHQYWSKYEVSKPAPILSGMSVQAVLGFYGDEKGDLRSVSSPNGLLLSLFIELIALIGVTYVLLRFRLKKRPI